MRVFVSVFDKSGIIDFLSELKLLTNCEIISTGGTYNHLSSSGIEVENISSYTKFPEILDGRVKSLHPKIYGGILFNRNNEKHRLEVESLDIKPIDIVVCNLYPFDNVILKKEFSHQEALENIDIGGPSMIRAAAKNYQNVIVSVNKDSYKPILDSIKNNDLDSQFRASLAYKAFKYISGYDENITSYFKNIEDNIESKDSNNLKLNLKYKNNLRYGENPHQSGAIYKFSDNDNGIVNAEQLNGKEMSFSNYIDADAAFMAVNNFKKHCVSIVKHTNTCGLAIRDNQLDSYKAALEGDPVSAFGGIIGFNSKVSFETAKLTNKMFFEIIIAPDYDTKALEELKKKKSLRVLKVKPDKLKKDLIRSISGGLITQSNNLTEDNFELSVVTSKKPSDKEYEDLKFAWQACSLIKSNAIVLVKNNKLVGMGAGQPNRLMSVKIAGDIAGKNSDGSVLASDAFFPFPDALEEAIKLGVKAVIQPGGSINDQQVINSADINNISMIFTKQRRFLH